MTLLKKLILPLLFVGVVSSSFYLYNQMRKYQDAAQRWEQNYSNLSQAFHSTVESHEVTVQQMEMTINEIERQSSYEIEQLRQQLRLSKIRIKDLEHAISFQQHINDTLYIERVDTLLKHGLENTIHLPFRDTLTKLDVYVYPNLTAAAILDIEATVYGFIYTQRVPVRERTTRFGNWWATCPVTGWTVRKKVVYMTDIKSNNPFIKLRNSQSLRVIKK